MARVDYDEMARVYHAGRGASLDDLAPWRDALAAHLPPEAPLPVLDIGSGTGQFALALATWFGTEVVGVEPSAGMRHEALAHGSHPRVRYVAGRAERLPLGARSAAAAWISTVLHHLDDLDRAAAEVRRVLVRGAPVLVRQGFPERDPDLAMYRFFPAAREVVADFPSLERVAGAFAAHGFALAEQRVVPQVMAPSLAASVERTRLRADTGLRLIPDEDFAAGIAAMERAAARETEPEPQVAHLHLLVLR